MMPGETGLDLTRSLRGNNDVPILLLTAMGETEDRIKGLDYGADDYLAKPFEPRELLLRINSILRRSRQPEEPVPTPAPFRFGRHSFDRTRHELILDGEVVHLTSADQALLAILAEQPGQTISREELAGRLGAGGNLRSIDVQITRLRRKIEDDPRQPRYLQTVRGLGYVLWSD